MASIESPILTEIDCCFPQTTVQAQTVGPGDRRAFAARSIRSGEVILRNAPLAHVVHNREEQCSYCLTNKRATLSSAKRPSSAAAPIQNDKLLRCGRCKLIWYCSRECQKHDFPLHKVECHETSLLREDPRGNAALLVRTFLAGNINDCQCRQVEHCFAPTKNSVVTYCASQHFQNLVQSKSTLHVDEWREVQVATKALVKQRKLWWKGGHDQEQPLDTSSLERQLEGYLRRFRSNNFGVIDSMVRVIAGGVYPLGALLNHSCAPNCLLRYNYDINEELSRKRPPVMEIVAAQNIAQGEELTHSYVELVAPTSIRRKQLHDIHGFECQCPRCTGKLTVALPGNFKSLDATTLVNWILHYYNPLSERTEGNTDVILLDADELLKPANSSSNLLQAAQTQQQQAKEYVSMGDMDRELCCLKDAVRLLEKASEGSFSLDLYTARCERLSCLIVANQMKEALLECRHIVAFLCLALSHVPNHPLLGLQLFTLGDLLFANAESAFAHKVYRWSHQVLEVCQGSGSEMVNLLCEKTAT